MAQARVLKTTAIATAPYFRNNNNKKHVKQKHFLVHPKHCCDPPHSLNMWFGVEKQHAWIEMPGALHGGGTIVAPCGDNLIDDQ